MYIGEMPNKIIPNQIEELVSGIAKENEDFLYISKYTYLKTFVVLVSNQRILTYEKDLRSIKQEVLNEQITDISKDIGRVVKIDLVNKKSIVLGLEKSDLEPALEALSQLKPGLDLSSSISKNLNGIRSDWQETKKELKDTGKELQDADKEVMKEIRNDWQKTKKDLKDAGKELKDAGKELKDSSKELKEEIRSEWPEVQKDLKDAGKDLKDAGKELKDAGQELGKSFKDLGKELKQIAKDASKEIKEVFDVPVEFIEKYGRCVSSGRVNMKRIEIFETGYVSISRAEPEKLLSIQSSINVSKKTGLGRAIGQTAAAFSPGMLAVGATSNRRGDVYLMIITDKNTYSFKEDLNSLSATLKNFESEQEVLKLEAAGIAVIEANKVQSSPRSEVPRLGIAEEIEKLKILFDTGTISEDEFQTAKRKLLE
ncbi:MAG: hypothetical protein RLZZ508_1272 [Actinomycetota bacterium]